MFASRKQAVAVAVRDVFFVFEAPLGRLDLINIYRRIIGILFAWMEGLPFHLTYSAFGTGFINELHDPGVVVWHLRACALECLVT